MEVHNDIYLLKNIFLDHDDRLYLTCAESIKSVIYSVPLSIIEERPIF